MYYNAQEVGARIRLLRTRRDMSQYEFAELIGVSRIHVANVEAGKGNPSIDMLIDIAERMDVSLDYLILGRKNIVDAKLELRAVICSLSEIENRL